MISRVVTIIFIGFLLAGCDQTTTTTTTQTVSNSVAAAGIQIVALEDGTKCAVLVGYHKGSIDCDWK